MCLGTGIDPNYCIRGKNPINGLKRQRLARDDLPITPNNRIGEAKNHPVWRFTHVKNK